MIISVITITYNNFEELKKTLKSIPVSDILESVIVDAGDCKETADFLKTYSGRVIQVKDKGISDAFNNGITNSSGKYLMFLNSGDELLNKEYISSAIEILNKNNEYSFVHSNLLFIDRSGTELFVRPPLKNIGRGMPYLHPTMVVRREVFDKIGSFNETIKIAMDYDWIVRLEKEGYKGYYLDKDAPVRMEGGGKSVVREREAIKECYKILRENNCLNFKNFTGYSVRYILFLFRAIMTACKLDSLLLALKKIKHSR
jgi:glycosyltransferase involved in cell wall biosynthesis